MSIPRTPPQTAAETGTRLLYSRKSAAFQLDISIRSLDYLIATKQLSTRRLGSKIMVPRSVLIAFSREDHFSGMSE